jgi:hypothetical protein
MDASEIETDKNGRSPPKEEKNVDLGSTVQFYITTILLTIIFVLLCLILRHMKIINKFLMKMSVEQSVVIRRTDDIDSNLIGLINQINGMTTIWLESGSYADRLILNIPTFNCCNCIYLIDKLNRTFTNKISNYCYCGKNNLNIIVSSSSSLLSTKILSSECTICLETYKLDDFQSLCQLACCHNFHKNCIYKWFLTGHYTCPVCRKTAS